MSRRRSNRALAHLADELSPEDGGDPKAFHSKPWDSPKAAGHKALQLCGQVKEALHSAFAACGNEVLQGLSVVGVEPAPNTGHLLAIVTTDDDRDLAVRQLQRAAGMLRIQVAAAICRRHAPELVFEVIG